MADPEMELGKRVGRGRWGGVPDGGMSGPRWVGQKNKNAPTMVGAHFSTGDSLREQYLVCQEENARKRAAPPGQGGEDYTAVARRRRDGLKPAPTKRWSVGRYLETATPAGMGLMSPSAGARGLAVLAG